MYWLLHDEAPQTHRLTCPILHISLSVAEETIGWLRIVRPGSVIGPQQQFMKDMQARMWREGDLMRQRLGISLPSEVDETNVGESKRDRSGSIESASRQLSGLSLSSAEKKYAEGASSTKPILNSRNAINGKVNMDTTAFPAEEDGQITQGDMLRQRRAHAHHLTPSEAKASAAAIPSIAQSKAKTVASSAPKPAPTRPTTRSQLSKLLGK